MRYALPNDHIASLYILHQPANTKVGRSLLDFFSITTNTFSVGSFCATPIPPFNDPFSCLKTFAACILQLSSCFRNAGFPDSLNCEEYDDYCSHIREFCDRGCPGPNCSLTTFRSLFSPPGQDRGDPSFSTSLYVCPTTSVSQRSSTSAVPSKPTTPPYPVPTDHNICVQPNNPSYGYSSDSPVGNIPLPYLTCNNDRSDFDTGRPFKLYTSSDTSRCPSYQRSGDYGPSRGCRDACDAQYQSCTGSSYILQILALNND